MREAEDPILHFWAPDDFHLIIAGNREGLENIGLTGLTIGHRSLSYQNDRTVLVCCTRDPAGRILRQKQTGDWCGVQKTSASDILGPAATPNQNPE